MGWTGLPYFGKPTNNKEREELIIREVFKGYNILHGKLIKDNSVNSPYEVNNGYVYYASVERQNDEYRIIAVILAIFDDDEWRYKDMTESVGPCYYDCPLRILKDVTCPDSEWAMQWREKVKERYYQKNAKQAAIKALKPGDTVKFTEVNYNGNTEFTFKCWNGKTAVFEHNGKFWKLNKWNEQEFTIDKAN